MSKNIVVVGSGSAGWNTAQALIKNGFKESITVVQSQPFTEFPILMPYMLRHPEKYEATANQKKGAVASIDHLNIVGCKYIVGTVTKIEESHLVINSAGRLPYDALVVCVGIHYPVLAPDLGQDLASRLEFVKAFKGKIAAARSVLIGGGGPVACEMACEVRLINPDCKVTMICSQAAPLAQWSGGARAALDGHLEKQNIDVASGDKVDSTELSFEPHSYTTSSGQCFEADVYLPFFGKARTQFMDETLLDGSGRIKVNSLGQSPENPKLFAVGCSNKYQVVNMPTIEKEAAVVAGNVAAMLKEEHLKQSLPDKAPGPPDVMWLHLGLGQYSIMNPAVAGTVPACLGRCCGCCNPVCPCCALCGWCCMFPASKIQSQCAECVFGLMGMPFTVHAAKTPEMVTAPAQATMEATGTPKMAW